MNSNNLHQVQTAVSNFEITLPLVDNSNYLENVNVNEQQGNYFLEKKLVKGEQALLADTYGCYSIVCF